MFQTDHATEPPNLDDLPPGVEHWEFNQSKLLISDAYRLSGQIASAISELMAIQQYVKKFVEIASDRAFSEARERAKHEGDD